MTIKEQIDNLIITDVKLGIKKNALKTKDEKIKFIDAYRDLNFISGYYDPLFNKLKSKL